MSSDVDSDPEKILTSDSDLDTRFLWTSKTDSDMDSDKVMTSDTDTGMSTNLGHGQTSDTRVRSSLLHPTLKIGSDTAVRWALNLSLKNWTDSAVRGSLHPISKIQTDSGARGYLRQWTTNPISSIFFAFSKKFNWKIPNRTNYEPNKSVRNRLGSGIRSHIIFFKVKTFFKSKKCGRKKSVPNQIRSSYQIGTEKSPISNRTK